MAYCWRCAEKIQDAALACRFCGADQNAPARWTKPPMTPTDMKPWHWILGGGVLLLLFSLLVSVRHVPGEANDPSPVAAQEVAPPAPPPVPPAGHFGNSYSAKLAQFGDAERHAMLARVVKSAGESCDGGYRTFFQGSDDKKTATWNVDCGGEDWMVAIASDSSTNILSCAVMDTLARKKSCWIDWGSSSAAAK